MMPDTLIVVPMKAPGLAKTRLQDVLDRRERSRLARQLFERTLQLIISIRSDTATPRFDIAVVTKNPTIRERARTLGLKTISERSGSDLNQAVTDAARAAKAAGYRRLCVVPADLAAPDPKDIRRLLNCELSEPGVALSPSRDLGTNALLVSPPDAIGFSYGPRSFHAHCRNAEAAGITPLVLPLESLRWDIDSSSDVAELMDIAPEVFVIGDQR